MMQRAGRGVMGHVVFVIGSAIYRCLQNSGWRSIYCQMKSVLIVVAKILIKVLLVVVFWMQIS